MAVAMYRDPVSRLMVPLIGGLTRDEGDADYIKLTGQTMTGPLTLPGTGQTAAGHVVSRDYFDNVIPIGMIAPFGGATPPTGWLLCNGTTVSRTTYADLFAAVSTTYNTGGEATTDFRLPNLLGRVTAGIDSGDSSMNNLGEVGGAKTVTLSTSTVPNVTAGITIHGMSSRSSMYTASGDFSFGETIQAYANPQYADTGAQSIGGWSFALGGGGAAHNNIQPYGVSNYAIRAL